MLTIAFDVITSRMSGRFACLSLSLLPLFLACSELKDDVPARAGDDGGPDLSDAAPAQTGSLDAGPSDAPANDGAPLDAPRSDGGPLRDACPPAIWPAPGSPPPKPPPGPSKLVVYDVPNGTWYVDANGNHVLDAAESSAPFYFGGGPYPCAPVVGAFSLCNDPRQCSEIGIFCPDPGGGVTSASFVFDMNQTHTWDAPPDVTIAVGSGHQEQGVVGRWDVRLAKSCMGIFSVSGEWHLDADCDGKVDGPGDIYVPSFGVKQDIAVAGDWTGTGQSRIGVFRAGTWLLDANGSGTWDDVACGDRLVQLGTATSRPVIGDWNGDGIDDVGVYDSGTWSVDLNGNGRWDGVAGGDAQYTFGNPTQLPVTVQRTTP